MALQSSWLDFGKGGLYQGYFSQLESKSALPGLILIQEVWGVDNHIQDVADRFAAQGYAVLAPDLYSQQGKHVEALEESRLGEAKQFVNQNPAFFMASQPEKAEIMAKLPAEQSRRINETLGQLFSGIAAAQDRNLTLLSEAARWLKARPGATGAKLGALGFCMGGGLAGLLACEPAGLDAAVIYYGQAIPKEKMENLHCKVLGFFGEKDQRLVGPLPEFKKAMKEAGKDLELHVYPGTGHAFFNDTRPSYNPDAARASFARCLEFLKETLS